tara:strand:+ start:64 stop:339 length:276 start_codon:yes stop_codon:yes gene_type:complete
MKKIKVIDSKLLELLSDLDNTYRSARFKMNTASIAADEYRHKRTIQERYGKARRHFRNVCIAVDQTLEKVEIQEEHKNILPTLYRLQEMKK